MNPWSVASTPLHDFIASWLETGTTLPLAYLNSKLHMAYLRFPQDENFIIFVKKALIYTKSIVSLRDK